MMWQTYMLGSELTLLTASRFDQTRRTFASSSRIAPRARRASKCVAAATLAVALFASGAALAQETRAPRPGKPLRWEPGWRRVGVAEYVATSTLLASSLTIQFMVKPEDEPDWSAPILFDEFARDNFHFSTRSGRDRASTASDILFVSSVAHPVVIDAFAVAWLGHGNADVAWQLAVIDGQTFATTFFLNTVAKRVFARERPYGGPCDGDPEYGSGCDENTRYRSFYSGHAAMTATAAGLTCSHHVHLPLYGGGWKDTTACVGAIGFTVGTGLLRIASDNHWATDVVAGHLIGFATGLAMPELLYYVNGTPTATEAGAPRVTALPVASEQMLGMQVKGLF